MASMTPNDIQFPPFQGHTVQISVINGARCHMQAALLLDPPPVHSKYLELAGYSFLIASEHRDQRVVYDLAFMKDLDRRAPPAIQPFVSPASKIMSMEEFRHVPDELEAHGVPLASINAVIWSHAHIDHVGDVAVFSPTTELVVGHGCPMTGYPSNPTAAVLDTAFQGRRVREIDFTTDKTSCVIGGFRAVDFFEDGSLFLLGTPGHTSHHLSALCRSSPDTWVFLAGDACHSVAQLRPSPFRPLNNIGSALSASYLASGSLAQPSYALAPGMQENVDEARETLSKLTAFDGRDDVMVILAHDTSYLDVLNFFPRSFNDWRAKGWADKARWLFLIELAPTGPNYQCACNAGGDLGRE